jgi:hypothetical protein
MAVLMRYFPVGAFLMFFLMHLDMRRAQFAVLRRRP